MGKRRERVVSKALTEYGVGGKGVGVGNVWMYGVSRPKVLSGRGMGRERQWGVGRDLTYSPLFQLA